MTLDVKNIKETLGRIQKYVLSKTIKSSKANNIKDLKGVSKVAWEFISSLYKAYWDSLFIDDSNTSLRNMVKSKFSPQALKKPTNNKGKGMVKPSYIYTLPPPISAKLPKEINEISKYFKKNSFFVQKKSYTQASSNGTNMARKMLKIKEAFPNLQNKKIKLIQKIISGEGKLKPHINITTKGPSCKQVIIPISTDNADINRTLKNIKSDVMADFICVKNKGVVISTNKVASPLDLQSIEKYVKNAQYIKVEQMESLRLPQSKLYLKIISIPYLSEHTNSHITSDNIEIFLKNNHIFNDIVLASKPRVIKVSPKLDMAII